MEAALARLLGEKVRLRAAGRTDAGVHAREQVVDFADGGRRPLPAVVRGGNALLPPDIRILSAEEAPWTFDARRHARAKEYRYFLRVHPAASPFTARYAWHVARPLDVEGMRRALACLVGEHDFSSFRAQGCAARSPVRRILSAWIDEAPEEGPFGPWPAGYGAGDRGASGEGGEGRGTLLCVGMVGTGFLRHMVRNIVGSLVEVGRGRWEPKRVEEALAARDRSRAGPAAPAHGLFLWRVWY